MINLFDLHNDYFVEIKTLKQKTKYINKIQKQGVKNMCSAVWTSKTNKNTAFEYLVSAKAFSEAKNINFSIEDLHFVDSISDLSKIIDIKPSYIGLTWNYENKLGGGANSSSGLTKWGKTVIRALEENNIQIDTAHMNEHSFMDFCMITKKPILCSHTAFSYINDHPRNFKDYQLKIIQESGGLVGLAFVKQFLTNEKKCNLYDIIRHIEYFVCRFGIDQLSIGTDFYGTSNLPKDIKTYKDIIKIQNKLFKMGYTTRSIEKIFYKNAERFFNKNL